VFALKSLRKLKKYTYLLTNCVTFLKLNRNILSEVTSLEMGHIEKFKPHRSEVTSEKVCHGLVLEL